MICRVMRGWSGGLLSGSVLICVILTSVSDVLAFDLKTHELVNERAADVSMVDLYLKEQLGLREGLAETVNGQPVRDWIGEGGAAEDRFLGVAPLGALVRSRHHFHNPILPWDQAGLSVLSGQASVRWAQNPDQGVSGKAAWGDARRAFYEALTRPAKGERDRRWADTFRILGQQIHLVADLAVPAHTRNDAHILGDGFEAWAERNRAVAEALIAGPPITPSQEIFKVGVPIPDPVATVPVARLWDSDQYSNNPGVTLSPMIGLAEYSNANFFSDDTVFSPVFPFPAATSVELGAPEPEPRRGELRRYFKKVRDGEVVDHVAVPSALYNFLPDALKNRKKGLDDRVFQDYAALLLPRAVGYSAALLDYFFRGRLAAFGDNTSVAFANYNEEAMQGTFTFYYDDKDGKRHAVPGASWNLSLAPGEFLSGFRFSEPFNPPPKKPDNYLLVFQGTLGDELNAVVGKEGFIPSVLEVHLVTRTKKRPLQGYKVETIDIGSEDSLPWTQLDWAWIGPDGKARLRWKPGKTILKIRDWAYWAGEGKFAGRAESAKVITPSDLDPEGKLALSYPLIGLRSFVPVEPCTGLLLAIPCLVSFFANQPSWKPPIVYWYWIYNYDGVGSLRTASGARTGEAVSILSAGIESAIFVRDDTGETTVIVDPITGTHTGKSVWESLSPDDLNKIGSTIGSSTVKYRAEYMRYVEDEEGVMIGFPICKNAYAEVVTLPVSVYDLEEYLP